VHGLTIENGSAYEQAVVDTQGCKKVVLPHDAVLRREGHGTKVQVFLKKTLGFSGHPTKPMSIRTGRKCMGCATKVEGDALVLATFGEWDSHIEGGARLRVVCVVPKDLEVEQRPGLSGPDSAGQGPHGERGGNPNAAEEANWYGPASPAKGWTAVPDTPDSDHRADG
jgi:hypothetical protein